MLPNDNKPSPPSPPPPHPSLKDEESFVQDIISRNPFYKEYIACIENQRVAERCWNERELWMQSVRHKLRNSAYRNNSNINNPMSPFQRQSQQKIAQIIVQTRTSESDPKKKTAASPPPSPSPSPFNNHTTATTAKKSTDQHDGNTTSSSEDDNFSNLYQKNAVTLARLTFTLYRESLLLLGKWVFGAPGDDDGRDE